MLTIQQTTRLSVLKAGKQSRSGASFKSWDCLCCAASAELQDSLTSKCCQRLTWLSVWLLPTSCSGFLFVCLLLFCIFCFLFLFFCGFCGTIASCRVIGTDWSWVHESLYNTRQSAYRVYYGCVKSAIANMLFHLPLWGFVEAHFSTFEHLFGKKKKTRIIAQLKGKIVLDQPFK